VLDFKAKMHQIRFPLGLRPRPLWSLDELTALPRSLAVFEGSTSKKRERGESEREERVGEGRRGGGRDLAHPKILS